MYQSKMCPICHTKFAPKSARQKYCKKEVIRTCPVCGKPFKSECTAEYSVCCSDDCRIKYAKQRSTEGMQKNVKICKFCGQEFHPKTNTQVMCDRIHYRTCAVCGNKFEITRKSNLCDIPITCSDSCKYEFTHRSVVEDIKQYDNMLQRVYQSRQLKMYDDLINDVIQYLKKLKPDIDIIQYDTSIINPLKLDVYLPEYKIGIECNLTSIGSINEDVRHTPIRYHQYKTDKCEENGIFLLHIFGYEWEHKKSIMKSIIANLIHANNHVIYARNCKIVNINSNTCRTFLDTYHRQGNANSSIRYGLTFQDELVAVMTFSKPRTTLKSSKFSSTKNCYELVRFCSKSYYNIVGGASKLFKHFIRTADPEVVYSYSDRAHTRGTLYSKLNFKEISRSDPGYMWVNLNTNIAYNRINAQKQNVRKFLNDDTIDFTRSETEIMESHGYLKVYDSGVITWEWSR